MKMPPMPTDGRVWIFSGITQYVTSATFGEQGWRSGENAHLPPSFPGFDSRSRCHNYQGVC